MDLLNLQGKLTLDTSEYEAAIQRAVQLGGSTFTSSMQGATGSAQQLQNAVNGAGAQAQVLGQQMQGATQQTANFGDMIKNAVTITLGQLFTQAVNKAKAALVGFAKQSISTGMSFDSAMSQVAATMGVTADQVQELREYAQQMGATTAFSATQSAEALNYMALAGYDAEKSMKMLPSVLNLAASGGMQLGRASDMVTDAQSALGLSLEQTTEMVNQMAMAASKSNTSVEQLGDAILQIGGTAKKLKGGTTELATILGILADNGMKGAEGGTHLRNMMNSLMSPTKNAKEMMSELNISLYDADGNMRSLNDVFLDMRNVMAEMATQQERDKVVSTIFNARDMKAAEALLAGVGDRYQQLSGYIDQAAGSAQNMANTKLDNLQGDITLFKSAVEGAQIAVSEKLTPALRSLTKFGSQAVSAMSEGFRENGLKGAIEGTHEAIVKYFGEDTAQKIMLVKSAVEIAAAAWVTYKATVVAAAITQEVLNAQMGNGVIISAAQKIGKAVSMISAHPIIALGSALAAASIAFKNFVDTMSVTVPDPYEYLNDSQKEFVDGISDLREKISESNKKWDESFQYTTKQLQHYEDLKKSLYSLDSAEEINAKDKERMRSIVAELNGAIEGLNLQLDAETGHLKNTREEIENTIDAYKRKIRAQAAEEQMLEVAKQQIDLEMKLEQAARERDGAEQKRNQLKLDYASKVIEMQKLQKASAEGLIAVEDQSRVEQRMEELEKELPELKQQIEDQETATIELQNAHRALKRQSDELSTTETRLTSIINRGASAMNDFGDQTEDTTEQVTAATEKQAEKVIKSIEDIAEAYDKALETRTGTFEKWAAKGLEVDNSEAIKAAENTAKQAAEALKKQLTAEIEQSNDVIQDGLKQMDSIMDDYYSEVQNRVSTLNSWVDKNIDVDVNADGEITFEDMDNALNETRYKLNEWSKDIAELSKRGISEGLLQQLEEAGPESEEKVKALLSASQKDLERYSENWEKAYSQIPDVAMEQLEKLKSETEQQVSELTNSLIAQSPEFRDALANVGFEAGQGYISALRGQTDEISQVVQEMFNTTKEQIAAQTQTESIIDPELTLSDLQTALDTTQKGFEEWANNIDELSKRGISQGLLQELEDAGPESAEKVKALLNATDPQLKKYSKTWEQLHKDIKSTAETQLSGLKEASEKEIGNLIEDLENSSAEFKGAMETVGVNVVDGYLDGIRSKLDEVKEVMKELYNEGTQGTVEDEAEISSPSKAMRRIGKYVGEGFALGIADEKSDVMSASKLLTESAISPMDVVTKGSDKSAYSGAESTTGTQQQQQYVFNLVTPDGDLIGRWIAPFVDAIQGQMMTFSTEGYAT